MNPKFLKIISLTISFVFSLSVIISFQNCGVKSYSQNEDSSKNKFSALSTDEADSLKLAETKLRDAHLDIFKFLDILDSFATLATKANEASKNININKFEISEHATPTEYLTQLYYLTNIFSEIVRALNTIPYLNVSEHEAMDEGLSELRLIRTPKPSVMVLKSLVLLVEIKMTFIEQLKRINDASITDEQRFELMKFYFAKLKILLTEFVEAMTIARPSDKKILGEFQDNFLVLINNIATLSYSSLQSAVTVPVPADSSVPSLSTYTPSIPADWVKQLTDMLNK